MLDAAGVLDEVWMTPECGIGGSVGNTVVLACDDLAIEVNRVAVPGAGSPLCMSRVVGVVKVLEGASKPICLTVVGRGGFVLLDCVGGLGRSGNGTAALSTESPLHGTQNAAALS